MRTVLIWSATWLLTASASPVLAQQPSASISGHVTNAASAPVGHYSVVIFPTDRSKWVVTSHLLRLAQPTADGSFEVTGLPPGEYWVAATDPTAGNELSGEWLKPEMLERLSFRATRVTVVEKQRVMTVLRLIRR
jgi:hypothetical protein